MTRPLPPLDLPTAVIIVLLAAVIVGIALLAAATADQRRLRRLPLAPKDQP